MRAEFHRPDAPTEIVGRASWRAGDVDIEADDVARQVLHRIFRRTPVAVDDPSLRIFGGGPVLLQPGSLPWFRAAAEARAPAEGLAVRFVPEGWEGMGWDPAGAYRPFMAAIERKERLTAVGAAPPASGEIRREAGVVPSAPADETPKSGTDAGPSSGTDAGPPSGTDSASSSGTPAARPPKA